MQQELKSELTKANNPLIKPFNLFLMKNGFKKRPIDRIMNAPILQRAHLIIIKKQKRVRPWRLIAWNLQKKGLWQYDFALNMKLGCLKNSGNDFFRAYPNPFQFMNKQHGCPRWNNIYYEIGRLWNCLIKTALKNIIENWKSALANHWLKEVQDEKSHQSNISSQAVAVYL